MTRVNTLEQRVGNRVWSGEEGEGVWGRIEGAYDHLKSHKSSTQTDLDIDFYRLQMGVDVVVRDSTSGRFVAGFYGHYANSETQTTSRNYADGRIKSHGYGVGATLTWYGQDGWYGDGVIQGNWYKSDLLSYTPNFPQMKQSNKGHGYAGSIEIGRRVESPWNGWSFVPQGQLTYKDVGFNSFTDAFDAHIKLDRGRELEGRLGVALEHGSRSRAADGQSNSSTFYGIANVYYDFMNNNRVEVSKTILRNEQEKTWAGLGMGGTLNWLNDRYSLNYEGLVNTSLNNFGNSYTLQGNVSFRIRF